MNDLEAALLMLSRAPGPDDDIGPINDRVVSMRDAIARRPPYVEDDPILMDDFAGLADVANRPEVRAALGNLQWKPALVDLTKVLSFQKVVHIDGMDERTEGTETKERLLELCMPTTQNYVALGGFADADGKGFTLSSYNPNLRIAAGQMSEANVSQTPGAPTIKMQAVTLLVYMGTSYLQVVRYRGRAFIRDGYHRAAGLLRRGVTEVPCVFIEARSFEEMGTPPGSFTYEVLFGEHPPRLADFWDENVALTVKQAAVRKVVRIRGEEFVVPR